MFPSPSPRGGIPLLAVIALATGACDNGFESPVDPNFARANHANEQSEAFEVYTQNVYLGGDTGPLFTLDFTNISAVLAAANQFWGEVQSSNIPERTVEFVNEIDARRPHVIALQEVLRFVVLDGSFNPTGGLDLLAEIEAEIAARGLPYETAVVQEATSSTLPLAFDPATGGISQWLNFTDRVVILRRSDVTVTDVDQGLYAASLTLGPVELIRGWARLTVDHGGTPYHFVATHLETQATGPLHDAQAFELQHSIVAGLEGVTIIAGDLNSDAAATEGTPSWTATYDNLMADGFTDVWKSAPPRRGASGVTCCHAPDLQGDTAMDERIDFVLVRSSDNRAGDWSQMRGLFRAEVVGDDSGDLTAGGLWPSDHAGISAALRIPASWR